MFLKPANVCTLTDIKNHKTHLVVNIEVLKLSWKHVPFFFFFRVGGGKGYLSDNGQRVRRLSSTVNFFYGRWTGCF